MSESIAELEQVLTTTPGVDAVLWMDEDGQVRASAGASKEKLKRLASFAKGMDDLGQRLCVEAGCGEAKMTLMQAETGSIAIHQIRDGQALLAMANDSASLGTLAYDLDACAQKLARRL